MSEDPLRPQPGSPIDPSHAVGRTQTTARARSELLSGNNLHLNDPRRMGKTVWLDLFCRAPGEGLGAVKIDFEGVATSEEFLLRAIGVLGRHQGLPSRAGDRLRAMFENVELAGGPITIKAGIATRHPTDLLHDTLSSVDEHVEPGSLLVIAMDEVPVAIANVAGEEGPAAAHRLLQTLRELRRPGSRLRWIVCGSVGLHHVLKLCDAAEGVINDLVNLPLGPLEQDEAEELARRLLLGIERPAPEAVARALADVGGRIPFLLHAIAHRLHDAATGPVDGQMVTDAFTDFMDDRDESRAATHLVPRLAPYYGADARAAETLLDELALGGSLTPDRLRAESALLDALVDDHYLVQRRGAIEWRYEVLRRIWVHRRRLA